ncbi:MAG: serine/threonine protein kinase [Myxococcales bacterium]|nr:serine/threonine protein kinase [Myxococcales bacterium]
MPRHIQFDAVRPGTVFAERYYVVRPIKAGGMGAVFEVQHVRTHKPHALKVMHPDVVARKGAREKFEQEAYINARIQSQHVVDVTDAGVDEPTGLPYIVMELLVGAELAAIVERERRVPAADLVPWLGQVARALDKAHAKGIIHRDLKPENIFVVRNEETGPTVKVLDFGIAKIVQGTTREGTDETGTPLYMAPEQTSKGQEIGPATDIWALGIVAYECLVGTPYWRAGSIAEFYRELLFEPLPPATRRAKEDGVELPSEFDAWFAKCCAREPAERFAAASEAVAALGAALSVPVETRLATGMLEPVRSPSPPPPPPREAPVKTPAVARASDEVPVVASRLSDSDLPQFSGNRRRNIAIVFVVLVLGGIGGAIYAARNFAATVPPVNSASADPVGTPAASPTPSGPPATIQQALAAVRPRKLLCYDKARKKNPKLAGKVVIDFKLDDKGKVGEAKVTSSTLADADCEACLLELIKSLEVQPPGKKDPREMTDTTELSPG